MPIVDFIPAFRINTYGNDMAYMIRFEKSLQISPFIEGWRTSINGKYRITLKGGTAPLHIEMDYIRDKIFVTGDFMDISLLNRIVNVASLVLT